MTAFVHFEKWRIKISRIDDLVPTFRYIQSLQVIEAAYLCIRTDFQWHRLTLPTLQLLECAE